MGKGLKFTAIGIMVVIGGIVGINALESNVERAIEQAAEAEGYNDPTMDVASLTSTTEPVVPISENSGMSEPQRLAMTELDPEMSAASDFIGALINTNGYLCAQVSMVEPAGGDNFKVTCVERRDGTGRVQYLVNGANNTARPI